MHELKSILLFIIGALAIAQGKDEPRVGVVPVKTSGKLVVNAHVGKLIIIQSTAKGDVEWRYSSQDFPDDQAMKLNGKLILTTGIPGTYNIMLIEWDARKIHDIVLIVTGPRPPPDPPVPPPDPDPKPTPPKADKLTLVVVWESADSTPATAKVLQDLDYWNGLKAQGHKWFKIDKDQKNKDGVLIVDANKYRPYIAQRGLPLLMIMGNDGTFFESLRLPATTAEITAKVKQWTR